MELIFKPVREADFKTAYVNLRDSLSVSFGSDQSLWPSGLKEMTESYYVDFLAKKISKDPDSMIHVWQNEKIIGQIEMSIKKDNPTFGYISLYYLISEKRGVGLGKKLDQFASDRLSGKGCSFLELTVQHSNKNAISFYKKQGWIEKGPHPVYPGLLMQKQL